jgi:hypothetical protein
MEPIMSKSRPNIAHQGSLFGEVLERTTIRDRVTNEGTFLDPRQGAGWRVLDARRERHTTWHRRRPIVWRARS